MSIEKSDLVATLQEDYLNYSITTLSRSIPSIVDGLKVSQRRLIQTAWEEGIRQEKPYVKSSKLCGFTMGNYHPHGSSYNALCNLSSPASMLYPLFDFQGNIGGVSPNGQKISDDPPAAERYTECRLSDFCQDVLFSDGSYKFSKTRPNYDGKRREIVEFSPVVPLALLTAQSGIAVGYSTNVPSYNLRRIIRYLKVKLTNSSRGSQLLPDFTSSCNLFGDYKGVIETGRGKFKLYADVEIDSKKGEIVIKELPSGSAETFCDKIKENAESMPMLSDVFNYSGKDGIHVVVKVKARKKSQIEELTALLYKYTNLSINFSANHVFVHENIAQRMGCDQIIEVWLKNRKEVLKRMFRSQLDNNLANIELFKGLCYCLRDTNTRSSFTKVLTDSLNVERDLKEKFNLNPAQIRYVLSLPVRQISKARIDELRIKCYSLGEDNNRLKRLLTFDSSINGYILDQLVAINKKYGRKCQTRITPNDVQYLVKPEAPEKTDADLWKEKALEKGAKLKKPITKRLLNKLIQDFYSGKLKEKSLQAAFNKLCEERNK